MSLLESAVNLSPTHDINSTSPSFTFDIDSDRNVHSTLENEVDVGKRGYLWMKTLARLQGNNADVNNSLNKSSPIGGRRKAAWRKFWFETNGFYLTCKLYFYVNGMVSE